MSKTKELELAKFIRGKLSAVHGDLQEDFASYKMIEPALWRLNPMLDYLEGYIKGLESSQED